jgi:hypothetical protein
MVMAMAGFSLAVSWDWWRQEGAGVPRYHNTLQQAVSRIRQ